MSLHHEPEHTKFCARHSSSAWDTVEENKTMSTESVDTQTVPRRYSDAAKPQMLKFKAGHKEYEFN